LKVVRASENPEINCFYARVELLKLPENALEEDAIVSLVRDGDVLHISFRVDLRS
jgi:hypothetical protein